MVRYKNKFVIFGVFKLGLILASHCVIAENKEKVTRIISGSKVSIGKYPWMAGIMPQRFKDNPQH